MNGMKQLHGDSENMMIESRCSNKHVLVDDPVAEKMRGTFNKSQLVNITIIHVTHTCPGYRVYTCISVMYVWYIYVYHSSQLDIVVRV